MLRRAAPDDNQLVALYGINRGNRKAYLHVEQMQASADLGELLPTRHLAPAQERVSWTCPNSRANWTRSG